MKIYTVRFSVSETSSVEVPSSYLRKCRIFYFLPKERSWMRVYLFFSRGNFIDRVVLEYREWTHLKWKLKILVPFVSDQKIGGQLGPLPRSFSPKSPDQNFEIAILFSIVEISSNYSFEDDLILHSPRGKGCNLWTKPIV